MHHERSPTLWKRKTVSYWKQKTALITWLGLSKIPNALFAKKPHQPSFRFYISVIHVSYTSACTGCRVLYECEGWRWHLVINKWEEPAFCFRKRVTELQQIGANRAFRKRYVWYLYWIFTWRPFLLDLA